MKLTLRIALGLTLISLAGRSAFAATTYTNTIAQMTAYIASQMSNQDVQGLSIALVDDQTVVWATGFGNADREGGVAADADTVYHVGSCSKAFLGTAYMQLLDQGRVDLEAPLTTYMPEFAMLPRFTNSGTVTIRSLLNHHSGIPGDFFNGMITTRAINDYQNWLINCLQGDYPFAPVNERAYYCNSGFVLLSDVIRRITGATFPAAMDTMLLAPLGMDASSFLPDKPAISNRLAAAYNSDGERQLPEILNAQGSGSMYSSANDQVKYIRMILADGQHNGQTLVSSNGIDVMTTPQLTNLPLNVTDDPHGLGWDNVSDYRLRYAGKVFWKDGATWFHCAYLGISRDLKLGVAVIQNSPGNLCDTVGIEALRWAILDKTGQRWPTNTFIPTTSPITNRPQEELDALAGLYVGSAGYHKIMATPGALTMIANAYSDTPVITSNLVPRANGWFSKTNSQDNQCAFTNLAGHDMLVVHQVDGAFESVNPLGEHYLPGPLSAAWCSRTNRMYRMVDMHPFDYFWEPGQPEAKTLRFTAKDGALMTSWMMGVYVIEPQNDNLAFQRGTHYRKGGAIQVTTTNGFELLKYSSYRFLDEAAIPTLPVNTITNGTIPFTNGTQWYWLTGETGKTYQVRLTVSNQNYFIRITDREGIVCSSGINGQAAWTCSSNGTYAIAVSATNTFAFSLSLTAVGLDQSRNDFDGDGKSDLAVYQAELGQWRLALSGSDYALRIVPMGGANCLACAADFDGDALTDPAVYDPVTGQLTAVLSASGYKTVTVSMGLPGAVPVFADVDGDRKADPTVYEAVTAQWLTARSRSGYTIISANLGGAGWSDAAEDFDGDALTDPAVYAPAGGQWIIRLSGQGYAQNMFVFGGGSGSMSVPGDYDGDGKADLTVYQPTGGVWLCALSGQGYQTFSLYNFGAPGLIPVPGDYDADGKTDPAVYDPGSHRLYILLSGSNYALVALTW